MGKFYIWDNDLGMMKWNINLIVFFYIYIFYNLISF